MNKKIIYLGEKVHNALRDFSSKESNQDIHYDLSGGCAVGSALLAREVQKKLGLHAEVVGVPGHAWMECKGYIYDVTAIQFQESAPKVRTLSVQTARKGSKDRWNGINYYSDYYSGLAYIFRFGLDHINKKWPKGQRPENYELKWLNQYKARIYWIG